MTEILDGFYRERLLNDEPLNKRRNSLAKRFRDLVKEYVETDPRYQSRMDEFVESSSEF